MLKNIDHRLNADVLHTLRAMGHGDLLVLSDRNFPASSVSTSTTLGKPLSMENMSSAEAVAAILSVFPLDTFVDDYAMSMEVVDQPGDRPAVQKEVDDCIAKFDGRTQPTQHVERFKFYDLARTSYAIIETGELRHFGCFIFRKGVISPTDAVVVSP